MPMDFATNINLYDNRHPACSFSREEGER